MKIVFAAAFFTLAGALILLAAMVPLGRLISKLPHGSVRFHWSTMRVLVGIFLLGYLAYAWFFSSDSRELVDLLVPVIFFLGACFVWLNAVLSLRTTASLLRLNLLEQENILDPLTGVHNRRYLERRLGEELARVSRRYLPLSVLMLDIDHFKQVNDRFGHQVGDKVLIAFARFIKERLREPDLLARYGGEEFFVVAPRSSRHGAIVLAERLRSEIASIDFAFNNEQTPSENFNLRITCSIGVASVGGKISGVEALVRLADKNLYRAKHCGRNQVNADEHSDR